MELEFCGVGLLGFLRQGISSCWLRKYHTDARWQLVFIPVYWGAPHQGIDELLTNTRDIENESERILDVAKEQVPVVTFQDPTQKPEQNFLNLVSDCCEATEHLINLDHERIEFIGAGSLISAKAKRGYLPAIRSTA